MNEDTPMNSCSRKGEIRAREAERLFEAHRRGEVRFTAGRAADFYGPGATLSHLGDQFRKPVIAGSPGRVLVNPDAIHTYHYVPDVAAGLAMLGTAGDDVYGRPWMLPCTPAESMRALVAPQSDIVTGKSASLKTRFRALPEEIPDTLFRPAINSGF